MYQLRAVAGAGFVVAGLWTAQLNAEPATQQQVDAALPRLEAYANALIEQGAVPGMSIAVVYEDRLVYLWGFGVREEGKPEAVDADTVFQLASFSKPISATVAAALVGEGALAWDSRIADIDPGFQLKEAYPSQQVTVRDLFAHRSGLPGDAGNELEQIGYPREEILRRLRLVAPSSSFRAAYSYSNFGITEGAVAAAKAAGLGWEEAADEKLFGPLAMTSTSYRHADFLSRENRATLHVRHDGKWEALSRREPDAQAPAGGASSSARDLARWLRLVMGGGEIDGVRLIDEAALAATHDPVIYRGRNPFADLPSFYGLGWNVGFGRHGLSWGHAGAFSDGARTIVSILPEHRLGIVVLANAFPTGAPEAVADTFFDYVLSGEPERNWLAAWNGMYESLFGPAIEAAQATYGTPPADATPALPLSAYVGAYANDYLGDAVVAEENGGLVLKLGPDGARSYTLTHFDRDLFTYRPHDEMPEMPVAASFRIGPDGQASELTLDGLNDLGLGTLKRGER